MTPILQTVEMTFRELEERGQQRGETVLGYYNLTRMSTASANRAFATKYKAPDKPVLNPPKDLNITIHPDRTKIVVISPFEN